MQEQILARVQQFNNQQIELTNILNRERWDERNRDAKFFGEIRKKRGSGGEASEMTVNTSQVMRFEKATIDQVDGMYSQAEGKLANIRKMLKEDQEKLDALIEEIRAQNLKLLEVNELI